MSWCIEPSQPQRITSGLKTNFSLSPSYSLTNCKTFHINFFFFFIFWKTHQSLARNQKYFRNHVPKEWIQRSLFEIFLSNLQQISTFNQDMFNCDYSFSCNTNRSLFFSQNKGMCQIRVTKIGNLFSVTKIGNLFKTVSSIFPCITKGVEWDC